MKVRKLRKVRQERHGWGTSVSERYFSNPNFPGWRGRHYRSRYPANGSGPIWKWQAMMMKKYPIMRDEE